MANINLFRQLVGQAARAGSAKKPRPSSTVGPTPRASARARAVASPNARFNRGTVAGPVQGPTKRMRSRRATSTTRRSPYGR